MQIYKILFIVFLNLTLFAQDKEEISTEAKKENLETKEEIASEPKKVNVEPKEKIQTNSLNQAERRMNRRFQIGVFFPATEYTTPKTLNTAFAISKKFSVNLNLSIFRYNKSGTIPGSSTFFVGDSKSINGYYIDFGIRYFPFEVVPVYFGILVGREISNEKQENLTIANGKFAITTFLHYSKVEYEPSKFAAIPIGFNWQFLNGNVLNFN